MESDVGPSSWAKFLRLLACIAALSSVLGCSGDEEGPALDTSETSPPDATWEVVNDAYRDGRLGPLEEVLASMRGVVEGREWIDFSERPADARFYHGDGSLKRLDEMTTTQDLAYLEWLRSDLVEQQIGEEITRAAAAARERRANEPEQRRDD